MKVLFCSLASYGFLLPSVGIALGLRARGHEVAFATSLSASGILSEAGIERIPRGAKDGDSFPTEQWAQPLSIAIQVKHIEHAVLRFAPDVLVGQMLALGPLIAAERCRLPVAVLGHSVYLWPTWPDSREPETDAEKRLAWRHTEMRTTYNATRKLFGMHEINAGPLETPLLGDLFFLQSVPELAGDVGALPPRVHLIGACLWEPETPDAELSAWLTESVDLGLPILYVHHGRSFQTPSFWPHVLEVLGDRPVRVAAAVGRMDQPVGAVPPNFYVRAHLPQGPVLRYARAVIGGGNTTAVLGALTHGLPSLLIPGGGEQLDVAERCCRIGAALSMDPRTITPEALSRAVEDMLHRPDLRASAQAVERAFAEYQGPERAASCIEKLALTAGQVGSSGAAGALERMRGFA